MLALLSSLWGSRRLILDGAFAVLIVGALAWVWHMHSTVATQKQTIATLNANQARLVAVNQENVQATAQAAQAAAAAQVAISALAGQQASTAASLGGQLATIKAAPASEAAKPVPPVVWQAIQGLSP